MLHPCLTCSINILIHCCLICSRYFNESICLLSSLCVFLFNFFLFSLPVSGGRSRLHLIDLGSCEKVLSKSRDGGGGLCLSLTALGNVILALTNGAKHVPYR